MGTDIHMAAEVAVFNDEGEQTGWEFVPGPVIDCWACDGTAIRMRWENRQRVSTGEPCGYCTKEPVLPSSADEDDLWEYEYEMARYVGPGKRRDTWYSDRNYRVFAALADVRNGSGFAGVYTHDPIVPISQPRGLPDGVTPETLNVLSDEHSQTWLGLDEVLSYDWGQPMWCGGVVDLDQYKVYVQTGSPDSWSGFVSGQSVKHIDTDEANRLIAAGEGTAQHPHTFVNIRWADKLDDSAEHFLDRMKMLAMTVGERKCRLVFDFDS
jgi:hypothetical protein